MTKHNNTKPPSVADIENAISQYNMGLQYSEKNNLEMAETAYKAAISLHPDFLEAHNNLGNILEAQGKLEAATKAYKKALNLLPDHPLLLNNIGNIYQLRGNSKKAIFYLNQAIQIAPDYAEAHNNLGNAYKDIEDNISAINSYQKAIQINPDIAEIHNNLGAVLIASGKKQEALNEYEAALSLQPDFLDCRINLVRALIITEKYDEAISVCNSIMRSTTNNAEIHYLAGRALQATKKLEDAINHYNEGLLIEPNRADLMSSLGIALYDKRKVEEAEKLLFKAISIGNNEDKAISYRYLALIATEQGDLEKTYTYLNKASKLNPVNLTIQTELAIQEWINGNDVNCKKHLKVISEMPHEDFTKEARSFIVPYFHYLNQLIDFKSKHPDIYPGNDLPALQVIGESHCLSPAHTKVEFNNQLYKVSPNLITGCKAWHLGNDENNKYKLTFESIAEKLQESEPVVLFVGEIDCRVNEGIIRFHKKTGENVLDIISNVVSNYLEYCCKILERKSIKPVIFGVPAPCLSRKNFSDSDARLVTEVVRKFNESLKTETARKKLQFIDVYSYTNNQNGASDGQYHIDPVHLFPGVFTELMENRIQQN